MSHRHTITGFTLLETVIVIGLSAAMMTAIGLLIFMFTKSSSYNQTSTQSSGSASAAMREFEALAVPADAVVQTRVFGATSYTSSAGTLILEIPSYDSSGVVIPSTYDYAVFYVPTGSTTLYRTLAANASSKRVSGTKKLSSTVNALTFTYDNATFSSVTTVTIDLQTRATAKQDVLTDHRHEQLVLRNH